MSRSVVRPLLALLGWILFTPALAETRLLHGGVIHTANPDQPTVEAMVYSGEGEILAVGSAASLRESHPDARAIDLGGRTVTPGFIDAHAHLMGLGIALMQVDLVGAESKEETLQRMEAFAETLPEDAWLLGRGWDQNDWPEKTYPTARDLDQRFPDRPVWVRRIDGHAAWANSRAMGEADRDLTGTWQPEGGRIERDGTGQANGIFIDRAMGLIDAAVPDRSPDEFREALRRALAKAASVGLTGVHEAGTSKDLYGLYREFIREDEMTLRIYAMADGDGDALRMLCEEGFQSERGYLEMRSVKLYADGALGSRGAALLEPYADDPDNRGLLIQPAEQLARQVEVAMGCGLQVNVHAIGDRGTRVVLDAYEAAMKKHPDNPGRHRVEHAQVIALDDLKRFHTLGLIASMQPTHATSDMYWAEDRVGPDRIRGAYAWRKLLDLQVPLAFGSDFPVEKAEPLIGFYAAVTRQDDKAWPEGGWYPEERMTRAEALDGFTRSAAQAAFAEDRFGTLEPGKRADFVVLSQDIMSAPVDRLLDTEVLVTVVDGRVVFNADGAPNGLRSE